MSLKNEGAPSGEARVRYRFGSTLLARTYGGYLSLCLSHPLAASLSLSLPLSLSEEAAPSAGAQSGWDAGSVPAP